MQENNMFVKNDCSEEKDVENVDQELKITFHFLIHQDLLYKKE